MTPLVTVVVATYNSPHTLRLTLESIHRQDFQDFEVQIVGDACTDNTPSVVSSFNDPRFFWTNLPRNCGCQAGPNNEGIKRARGKYIAYLGHDDLWFPWHLSTLVTRLEETEGDFASSLCASIAPKERGQEIHLGFPATEIDEDRYTAPSSWLHRKELVEECGFWNCNPKELIRPIDKDFWIRILRAGKKMDFAPVLSVLKYPSPWWKTYALKGNYPQEKLFPFLMKDPKALQVQLLTSYAAHLHQKVYQHKKWRFFLKQIAYRYGIDRFPLSYLKKWRYQRQRKRDLILRGLKRSH